MKFYPVYSVTTETALVYRVDETTERLIKKNKHGNWYRYRVVDLVWYWPKRPRTMPSTVSYRGRRPVFYDTLEEAKRTALEKAKQESGRALTRLKYSIEGLEKALHKYKEAAAKEKKIISSIESALEEHSASGR